jgi:hypothetical protein
MLRLRFTHRLADTETNTVRGEQGVVQRARRDLRDTGLLDEVEVGPASDDDDQDEDDEGERR